MNKQALGRGLTEMAENSSDKGWYLESIRHSNAKKFGRAGGTYASKQPDTKIVKPLIDPTKKSLYEKLKETEQKAAEKLGQAKKGLITAEKKVVEKAKPILAKAKEEAIAAEKFVVEKAIPAVEKAAGKAVEVGKGAAGAIGGAAKLYEELQEKESQGTIQEEEMEYLRELRKLELQKLKIELKELQADEISPEAVNEEFERAREGFMSDVAEEKDKECECADGDGGWGTIIGSVERKEKVAPQANPLGVLKESNKATQERIRIPLLEDDVDIGGEPREED